MHSRRNAWIPPRSGFLLCTFSHNLELGTQVHNQDVHNRCHQNRDHTAKLSINLLLDNNFRKKRLKN